MEHLALGIDIGGTNTAYGLVDRQGNVFCEGNISTKDFQYPIDLVEAIYSDLKNHDDTDRILGIGIGAPNGNTFTGNIEFAPNLNWKGIVPIAQLFEDKFHRPALLTNDANAAAIGEHLFGNAQDLKDFVVITLGTGLGSGIFIDNNLVIGNQGLAGEFGHVRVDKNGRLCGCGRRGCLETYASSTGVVRSFEELEHPSKLTTRLNKDGLKAHHIFEEAMDGDEFALHIVNFTADILGSALADFAAFSNPKAYILFGGIAQSGSFFADKVKAKMEDDLLIIYKNQIEIRISHLHDTNAAVLGTAAAMFWKAVKK